jgi:hypothetical protein
MDVAAYQIARSLALAEAKAGFLEIAADRGPMLLRAAQRLELIIEKQSALGTKGLHLAASYEARAKIAAWMGDKTTFERYAHLTAAEYPKGHGWGIAGRYPALQAEAQLGAAGLDLESPSASIERELLECESSERCARALARLCELHAASAGQLLLRRSAGLELVASVGEHVFTSTRIQAEAYLERELGSDATITQDIDDENAAPLSCSNDLAPERMTVLVGSAGAEEFAIGVVMLAPGPEHPDLSRALQLSKFIGSILLRTGEAHLASARCGAEENNS